MGLDAVASLRRQAACSDSDRDMSCAACSTEQRAAAVAWPSGSSRQPEIREGPPAATRASEHTLDDQDRRGGAHAERVSCQSHASLPKPSAHHCKGVCPLLQAGHQVRVGPPQRHQLRAVLQERPDLCPWQRDVGNQALLACTRGNGALGRLLLSIQVQHQIRSD